MKSICKYLYVFVLSSLAAVSCATREMVSEKSLEYLNRKYHEQFKVISVNMNHDEGNWGSADLVIAPYNDSSLAFRVVYDYSSDRLTWENYKGVLWNRDIGKDADAIINTGKADIKIKARITSKGSITLDSMNLPDKKNYNEIIPVIERPAVAFDIDIFSTDKCSDFQLPYVNFITAANAFRLKGFQKVMFSVNLYCGDGQEKAGQILRFKLTRELPLPDLNLIRKLKIKSGESPVDMKISGIYSEAEKFRESGRDKEALPLYLAVIKLNDNPYRYDPYAPVESGCVIESAFYAAEIERKNGNFRNAEKLYTLVFDRIRYMEIKAEYYRMEIDAGEKLKELMK